MSETLAGNIAQGGNYLPGPGKDTSTVSVSPAANSGSKIAFPSGTRVVNVDAPGDGDGDYGDK